MILHIKVHPNSKVQEIKEAEGILIISLKSPPENNKANIELINILAKHFKVAPKDIKIKSGLRGRKKLIEIKKTDNDYNN